MAQIDIDEAFETIVSREKDAVERLRGEMSQLNRAFLKVKNARFYTAFQTALANREEFVADGTEWVKYAMDENLMAALAKKINGVFDSIEELLGTIEEAIRESYTLHKDEAFNKMLQSCSKSFSDFQRSLLLPATDLFSYVDFMYAGSLYRQHDATVQAVFSQCQDVVATVESLSQLIDIEQHTHWAGDAESKIVLADAFRSLVREGELTLISAKGPSKKRLWLFTDMIMFGAKDDSGYGVEKTIPLARCGVKSLENAGMVRNAFTLRLADAEEKFSCSNAAERDSWLADIDRCVKAATSGDVGSGTVATVSTAGNVAATDTAGAAERIRNRLANKASQQGDDAKQGLAKGGKAGSITTHAGTIPGPAVSKAAQQVPSAGAKVGQDAGAKKAASWIKPKEGDANGAQPGRAAGPAAVAARNAAAAAVDDDKEKSPETRKPAMGSSGPIPSNPLGMAVLKSAAKDIEEEDKKARSATPANVAPPVPAAVIPGPPPPASVPSAIPAPAPVASLPTPAPGQYASPHGYMMAPTASSGGAPTFMPPPASTFSPQTSPAGQGAYRAPVLPLGPVPAFPGSPAQYPVQQQQPQQLQLQHHPQQQQQPYYGSSMPFSPNIQQGAYPQQQGYGAQYNVAQTPQQASYGVAPQQQQYYNQQPRYGMPSQQQQQAPPMGQAFGAPPSQSPPPPSFSFAPPPR